MIEDKIEQATREVMGPKRNPMFLIATVVIVCVGLIFALNSYGLTTFGKAIAPPEQVMCEEQEGNVKGFKLVEVDNYEIIEQVNWQNSFCFSGIVENIVQEEVMLSIIGKNCVSEGRKKILTINGVAKEFFDNCIDNNYKVVKKSNRIATFDCLQNVLIVNTESCDKCVNGECI